MDTSDNDFDDSNNCVNDLDNTPFATCIEDISIAEEIAGNGDDLPFGPHVKEVQLNVDESTANLSVTSPGQLASTESSPSPNQVVNSSAQLTSTRTFQTLLFTGELLPLLFHQQCVRSHLHQNHIHP